MKISSYPSVLGQNYLPQIIWGGFLLISRYSLVFVQKILGPKFFVRFPFNSDAYERHSLLTEFWCSVTVFLLMIAPAKGKRPDKGKGLLRVTAPDRKRPKG
ncbi:TPA: hypothetical protein N2G30_004168 [Salmonella enterica]|nr:hypothetical protein [Salmonella enterica]